MVFVKSFPRTLERQGKYPEWEETSLTEEEEREQELLARIANLGIIKECVWDVKELMKEKNLKPYQTDVINMAIALFEKRASHNVFWKEKKCREKFDALYNKDRVEGAAGAAQTILVKQTRRKLYSRKKAKT